MPTTTMECAASAAQTYTSGETSGTTSSSARALKSLSRHMKKEAKGVLECIWRAPFHFNRGPDAKYMLHFFGSVLVTWLRRDPPCVPRERPLVPAFDAEDAYYKEFTTEKKRLKQRLKSLRLRVDQRPTATATATATAAATDGDGDGDGDGDSDGDGDGDGDGNGDSDGGGGDGNGDRGRGRRRRRGRRRGRRRRRGGGDGNGDRGRGRTRNHSWRAVSPTHSPASPPPLTSLHLTSPAVPAIQPN